MTSFHDFRENVQARFHTIMNVNILQLEAHKLDDVFLKAETYFNVDVDTLRFEIESFQERTVLKAPFYKVIVYPNLEYSFIDKDTDTIKNVNGESFVRRAKGSIQLFVSAPEEGGTPVVLKDVIDRVMRFKVISKDISTESIEKIVNKKESLWGIVGTFDYNDTNDAEMQIKVSDDEMHAHLFLRPALDGGSDPSIKDIMTVVQANGIIYGIKNAVIDRLEKVPIYNEWIEVAEGKPAANGNDSKIEIIVRQEKKTSEKYTALITVSKGEIVAKKILFTEGAEGRTLMGEILYPDIGDDLEMLGNTNVEISNDNTEAKALVSGSIYVKGTTVYVDKIWEIQGDLTPEIGDIDFPGSVIIRGNINDDFQVKVSGNLTVLGSVGKSFLNIGGNLEVVNGINGRGAGHINVEGSLYTKFLERADVTVGNYCIIVDSIINANILCYNKVIAISGRGRITSSTIIAEKEMILKKVGSEMGDSSDLQVISLPNERKKLEKIYNDMHRVNKEIEKKKSFFGEGMNAKKIAGLSKTQKQQIKEMIIELKQEQNEYKRLQNVAHVLRKKIKASEGMVNIYILDSVLEQTKITLNEEVSILRHDFSAINFFVKDDKIVNKNITDIKRLIDTIDVDKLFHNAKL